MLVHDRFVFLHAPKTGGRFVRKALSEETPGCVDPYKRESRHYGWDKIPEAAAGRPVLAFVRNPWDWYVSWYTYMVDSLPAGWAGERFERHRAERPLFRRLFTTDPGGTDGTSSAGAEVANDFTTTVRRACTGIVDGEDREELERTVREVDIAEQLMEGHDLYSAHLVKTFGAGSESDLLTIGRYESLADDLVSFLEQARVNLDEDAGARIHAMDPVGASRRGPYRTYYDDDLRDLVGFSCRTTIERFGYSF